LIAIGLGGKVLLGIDGGEKMRREKSGTIQQFSGPLWDDRPTDLGETVVLEALVKASYEDPDDFREEWVNPLMAEGLNLDQIFDLLLTGTARPN
jgi:hypothetical protein